MNALSGRRKPGLLGDTPARDYGRKLALFNAFAAPELQQAVKTFGLLPGMSVLDAGCGTGETLRWLQDAVSPTGVVVGMDLSAAHTAAARATEPTAVILQGNLASPPLRPASFDLIWCANALHHLRDPLAGLITLMGLLRTLGRLVLAQSALLPELFFAWDSRLERKVNDAVRRYYQERYAISDKDFSKLRGLVGLAHRAQLRQVSARTIIIERIAPLAAADHAYLLEAIFRDTWGERLRPYLASADFDELTMLCSPDDPSFALHRPDFHYMQSLTLVTGTIP
jgi:SAM-dependent methyltransferase